MTHKIPMYTFFHEEESQDQLAAQFVAYLPIVCCELPAIQVLERTESKYPSLVAR
jgi:hypothetical protein